MGNYDFGGMITILIIFSAIAGWCVIEFVLWLLSFVTVSFGG